MKRRTDRPRGAAMRAKTMQRKTSKPKRPAGKSSRAKSSRNKVQAYRARMRAKGLRLVQMWLPDTSTPEFAAAAHRASLAIANSPTEKEDQAFIDSISWLNTPEADKEWTYDWPPGHPKPR
jgi:hypothetical protein